MGVPARYCSRILECIVSFIVLGQTRTVRSIFPKVVGSVQIAHVFVAVELGLVVCFWTHLSTGVSSVVSLECTFSSIFKIFLAASNDFPWPLSFKIQSLSQAERRILVVTLHMILCLLVCSTSLSRSGKRSLITSIRPNQLTASILVDLFVSHRNCHHLSCMSSPKVVRMNICGLPRNAVFVKLRQLTVNFTRFF